ncbi:MAG: phosphoribosylaminoimidazolesuccinocarboxamide synthase [Flavobacteriaceae bacterium]
MATNTLMHTDFEFVGQTNKYTGKVREVYTLDNDTLIMVATDRLSAFDVVMPRGIPFKGQILNQIATHMMQSTADLVPNWILSTPDPNVAVGKKCTPFKIEMVIRGYLSGHAAREYKAGKRMLCGVPMPEGMKEHDAFPSAIITPATKAEQGDHDEDISEEQILEDLLPRFIKTQIFGSLLEREASEQGASMTAMDNATRNAGELINKLTIQYNRSRQAAITTELIEIIAGAEAL